MELTPPTIRDGPVNDSTLWTKEGRPQSEEEVLVNVFISLNLLECFEVQNML